MTTRFALKALILAVGLGNAFCSLAAKLTVVEVITSPPRTALLQKMLDEY